MKNCDLVKLSRCFWCGKEKNELILPKKQNKAWCDNKSMSVVVNYEPCDACREEDKLGVRVIEVQDTPLTENQPEIQEGFYPTSHTWVVDKDVAKKVFETDNLVVMLEEKTARLLGLYSVVEESGNTAR